MSIGHLSSIFSHDIGFTANDGGLCSSNILLSRK